MSHHYKLNILGVDIGSVSISIVEITPEKEVVKTAYEFHHGNITETLKNVLNNFDLSGIRGIASTSSTPPIIKVNSQYDNRISIISAARHFHEKTGSILIVGGERALMMTVIIRISYQILCVRQVRAAFSTSRREG
jgi:activator of 2-hydroxyglutaryl-CoA dehydratase